MLIGNIRHSGGGYHELFTRFNLNQSITSRAKGEVGLCGDGATLIVGGDHRQR